MKLMKKGYYKPEHVKRIEKDCNYIKYRVRTSKVTVDIQDLHNGVIYIEKHGKTPKTYVCTEYTFNRHESICNALNTMKQDEIDLKYMKRAEKHGYDVYEVKNEWFCAEYIDKYGHCTKQHGNTRKDAITALAYVLDHKI